MTQHSTTPRRESIGNVQSQRSDLYRERVAANKRRKEATSRVNETRRELRDVSRKIVAAERAEKTSRLTGINESDVSELKAERRSLAARVGAYSRVAQNSQTKVETANEQREELSSRIESMREERQARREQSRTSTVFPDTTQQPSTPAPEPELTDGERRLRDMRNRKKAEQEEQQRGSIADRIREKQGEREGAPVASTDLGSKYQSIGPQVDGDVGDVAELVLDHVTAGNPNPAQKDGRLDAVRETLQNVKDSGHEFDAPDGKSYPFITALSMASKDSWSIGEVITAMSDILDSDSAGFPYKGVASVK